MKLFKTLLFVFFTSSYLSFSLFGIKQERETCKLLEHSKMTSVSQFLQFPLVGPSEHSMSEALPEYVTQKIPTFLIKHAIENGLKIEIVGMPPPILLGCSSLGHFKEIPLNYEKKGDKQENFRRPSYFYRTDEKETTLVVSVMAGEDYIKQYTALISYYVKFYLGKKPDDFLRVRRFPALEKNMSRWTNLDKSFVKPNDTVLIGNVSDFFDYLKGEGFFPQVIEEAENFYYKATRVKLGERTLNFLRVKYSFWGNMSAHLVKNMMDLGASEIIYMSKIATLNKPSDIYKKIYSPSQFAVLEEDQIKRIDGIVNPLIERFPELDSGAHLSIATVMEQDFESSALAHTVASSLDLEVSKIAQVIAEYNLLNNKQIPFTPVHWVTDYLRTKEEVHLDTGFDLSNGDSKTSKEKKRAILKRIYQFVTAYLLSTDLEFKRKETPNDLN